MLKKTVHKIGFDNYIKFIDYNIFSCDLKVQSYDSSVKLKELKEIYLEKVFGFLTSGQEDPLVFVTLSNKQPEHLSFSLGMKRHTSSRPHRDENYKSSRTEDNVGSRSRDEEERLRRRRKWLIQQEQERKHEELKRKKILEYERQRARLLLPKRRCDSKSKSKSPSSPHGRTSVLSTSKPPILSEKLESSNSTTPLFKGPEGTQISATELRRIKVDIHRNLPGRSTIVSDLQRDIINPEDVVLKRREGEGSKPIFEREEITRAVSKTAEVEEHRTVVTVTSENLESKKPFKRRSVSLSPTRTRSHSPRRTSSRHSSLTNALQRYGEKTEGLG